MPVMLERWSDDKMDALEGKVDGLSDLMREQRRDVRQEMRKLRQEMADLRKDAKDSFERLYRGAIFGVLATGGFVAGFAGLIVLIAAQH